MNKATIILEAPKPVLEIIAVLHDASYEAYIVGGSVRDLLIGRTPKDWDITTNATPDKLVELFEEKGYKVVYENAFGTVTIVHELEPLDSPFRAIEITPYRTEGNYEDYRRPSTLKFSDSIEEDLKRRDFTINALAYDPVNHTVLDNWNGILDLNKKVIKAVGNPPERFREDALRMLRAIRFASELDFEIETQTLEAIIQNSELITRISKERIWDEFEKIINSPNPKRGLELSRETHLLKHFLPELLEGYGIDQNRNHIYDVWTHNLNACQNSANQNWPLHIRLAALFHDIGKPRTKRFDEKAKEYTFYGHEVVGARMVNKLMTNLKTSGELKDKVVRLVRYHMFFSDTDQITLSAVRRMIVNVGEDLIWDLMKVRQSDRIGMGRPNAQPFRLRMYESMIEEALRDPISVKKLVINGDILMRELGILPGPRMGWLLHAILDEVLEDPLKNTREYIDPRLGELNKLSDIELKERGEKGIQAKENFEAGEIKELRVKHGVQKKK